MEKRGEEKKKMPQSVLSACVEIVSGVRSSCPPLPGQPVARGLLMDLLFVGPGLTPTPTLSELLSMTSSSPEIVTVNDMRVVVL